MGNLKSEKRIREKIQTPEVKLHGVARSHFSLLFFAFPSRRAGIQILIFDFRNLGSAVASTLPD
jgi:hypothetical protein